MAKETDAKITVKKNEDFSEWFTQLMKKAELADIRYKLKGFPIYMPWATWSIRNITRMWEEELELRGHEPVIFPLLIPEEYFLREADHVKGFTPDVFWVTHGGDKKFTEKYALRPTSETAMYDMYSKWIQSYNDLPLKRYQTANVFRYESKMTRPFMRTRELHWTESHNVFETEKEAYNDAKENLEITHKLLYGKMAIPHIFFKRPKWDTFPGAKNTFAADVLLDTGKVLQLPSSHLIDQGFSKAFDVKYLNREGNYEYGWITCYGPCHSRNYGALITFHGDDKGLVLPYDVAPKHIVIVPLLFKGKEETVLEEAKKINEILIKEGYKTILDSRSEVTPGFKFNHWELKGVPIRITIGPKDIEKNQVEIFRRDLNDKQSVGLDDMLKYIKEIKEEFTQNLQIKGNEKIKNKIIDAKNIEDIKIGMEKGYMVRTCFCSIDMDGEECAKQIEVNSGGEVRGESFEKKEEVFCACPVCGKKANHVVYIAKSH